MKKIFLLLCLVAGSASASDYLVWRDESGTEFVLTADKPFICAGMERMYSTDSQGNKQTGCWMKIRNEMHINYISTQGVVEQIVLDASKFQRKARSAGQPTQLPGQLTQQPGKTINLPR
jgi:hypothetical protein